MDKLTRDGYVILSKPKSISTCDLHAIEQAVLLYAESLTSTFRYKLWRYFNGVHTIDKRHSIPLPLVGNNFTITLPVIIKRYVQEITSMLQIGVFKGHDAKLVELAALISYPGAAEQRVHSDMQYTKKTTIITCFIALRDVTLKEGPTNVFPRTHTKAFHARNATAYRAKKVTFSADGERESNEDIYNCNIMDKRHSEEMMQDVEAMKLAQSDQTKQAILSAGDMLLFNAAIFHFGGANLSAMPRVLLGFAFQSNLGDKEADFELDKSNGFTYHIAPDVEKLAPKLLSFRLDMSRMNPRAPEI